MAYAWDSTKSNLSIVNVGGSNYYLKDAEARTAIDSISATVSGVMHWRGISSTDPTTGTVTIGGQVLTPAAGDVVGYQPLSGEQLEYAYNGTTWEEFGSTGTLKAFAFADTGTVTFTPSINSTLAISQGTVSASGTLSTIDTVSFPSFAAPTGAAITKKTSTDFVTGMDSAVKASVSGETLTFTVASATTGTCQEVDTIGTVVTSVSLGSASYTSSSKDISVSGSTASVALTGTVAGVEQTETVNPVSGS